MKKQPKLSNEQKQAMATALRSQGNSINFIAGRLRVPPLKVMRWLKETPADLDASACASCGKAKVS